MSALVLCPDCKRKLKVPDTAVGKTIRCPTCKTPIPTVTETQSSASDPESDESDALSPRRSVKTAPPPRTAPRGQLNRDEDREDDDDDDAPAVEKPLRKKPSGKRRPNRKKSSAGPIIGLAVGGVLLLIVLVGIGFAAFRYLGRSRTIPEAEWQTFTPPNSSCTILMPGRPVFGSRTTNGVTVNVYEIERDGGKMAFAVAVMDLATNALPPNALEMLTNPQREQMTRRMNGNVTSETAVTLGNIPGHEFHVTPSQHRGMLIERIYLAKIGGLHRCYALLAAGDYIAPNTGDAARFFDSFKIDASATPPTFGNAAAALGPQQPPFANQPPANPGAMPPQPNPRPIPPQGPRFRR
ncbi:MAG TPA: hypothetical protein VH575_14765 [Gemmataceae bacterium]|jgi:hypothetical protein